MSKIFSAREGGHPVLDPTPLGQVAPLQITFGDLEISFPEALAR